MKKKMAMGLVATALAGLSFRVKAQEVSSLRTNLGCKDKERMFFVTFPGQNVPAQKETACNSYHR